MEVLLSYFTLKIEPTLIFCLWGDLPGDGRNCY